MKIRAEAHLDSVKSFAAQREWAKAEAELNSAYTLAPLWGSDVYRALLWCERNEYERLQRDIVSRQPWVAMYCEFHQFETCSLALHALEEISVPRFVGLKATKHICRALVLLKQCSSDEAALHALRDAEDELDDEKEKRESLDFALPDRARLRAVIAQYLPILQLRSAEVWECLAKQGCLVPVLVAQVLGYLGTHDAAFAANCLGWERSEGFDTISEP